MSNVKSFGCLMITKEAFHMVDRWAFPAGIAKKSTKGVESNAPNALMLSKVLPDSVYPHWLRHFLDKRPALSELSRKTIGTLSYEEDLICFIELDSYD